MFQQKKQRLTLHVVMQLVLHLLWNTNVEAFYCLKPIVRKSTLRHGTQPSVLYSRSDPKCDFQNMDHRNNKEERNVIEEFEKHKGLWFRKNDDNTLSKDITTTVTAVSSALAAASVALVTLDTFTTQVAVAADDGLFGTGFQGISQGSLNPENFQPVCPTADGLYRVLQSATMGLVGKENFVEYGPLIAGGLLRVRLELCVVESFFNEAVGPFIAQNGLSWILPIHETVETFLAGGIFALATTFILIGSTKILTVLVTYTDFIFGLPSRLFGGFAFDRAQKKPVTLDIGFGFLKTRLIGPPETKPGEEVESNFRVSDASFIELVVLFLSGIVKTFGELLGFIREVLEKIDFFVGRYLVLWASGYLIIKFLHFKVFPDFPDFL